MRRLLLPLLLASVALRAGGGEGAAGDAGRAAFLARGCFQCHSLAGLDRPRPPEARRAGPSLPRVRSREWNLAHLYDPRTLHPSSGMSGPGALFAPHPKEAEIRALLETFDAKDGSPLEDGIVSEREYVVRAGGGWRELLREYDANGDEVVSEADAAPVPSEEAKALADLLSRPAPPRDPAPFPPRPRGFDPRAAAARGGETFLARCAGCHGARGDGNGPAARFFPERRPRNFLRGEYKVRSTIPPDPPLDADLFGTIRRGLGPHMPAFPELSDGQVLDLVEHLKSLHPLYDPERADFEEWVSRRPVEVGPEPFPYSEESAELGEKVFVEFGCAGCHGLRGRGDGLSAPNCRGSAGEIVRPVDFTKGELRFGPDAPSIVRVLLTGLQGAAMPSYRADFELSRRVPPAEAPWRLAHYVQRQAGVAPR